jgi:hypothetical protein
MDSAAMIYSYIPSFTNIGSGIQKMVRGDSQTHRNTDSMEIAQAYFNFFKIRKVG